MTQERTGVAGQKSWEVIGRRTMVAYPPMMPSLNHQGEVMTQSE